ncbi:MAG: hypothetical protein IT193_01190 [Propionibacteriaceae bacterium]|nr:hypothetical protein [Propionibacteriaceae bacterium]
MNPTAERTPNRRPVIPLPPRGVPAHPRVSWRTTAASAAAGGLQVTTAPGPDLRNFLIALLFNGLRILALGVAIGTLQSRRERAWGPTH